MLRRKKRSHLQHGCVLSVGIKAPELVSFGVAPADVDAVSINGRWRGRRRRKDDVMASRVWQRAQAQAANLRTNFLLGGGVSWPRLSRQHSAAPRPASAGPATRPRRLLPAVARIWMARKRCRVHFTRAHACAPRSAVQLGSSGRHGSTWRSHRRAGRLGRPPSFTARRR